MHRFLDNYSVWVTSALFHSKKWFRNGIESVDFLEHIAQISLNFPEDLHEGIFEAGGTSLAGPIDPAFHVVQWIGPEYPTILYHHGNNERPFDYGFASKNTFKSVIMVEKETIKANIINLRAPFHNQGMKAYLERIGQLSDFMAMIAGSVVLMELLVQHLKSIGCNRIMVAGISLGGWAVNLHRSFYNTAEVYVPLLAGAALDELFLSSAYSRLLSNRAKDQPELIHRLLNFEGEFSKVTDQNVFPLLAQFDQMIEFERQKQCYMDYPVQVIEKGHITGALSSEKLRSHLLRVL